MEHPWTKPELAARQAMREGRFKDAIPLFSEAIALVPWDYWEPNTAANMICDKSRCEEALRKTMFQSNALWPDGVCASMWGDNISTDTHASREEAEAVCRGLEREGFGGERKHFPVKTWVSGVQMRPRVPPEENDTAEDESFLASRVAELLGHVDALKKHIEAHEFDRARLEAEGLALYCAGANTIANRIADKTR